MTAIFQTLTDYKGSGLLLIFYAASLVYVVLTEKDRRIRTILAELPLVLFILFLLPPVYRLYTKLEDTDTYYRILWLLPQTVTMLYAAVRAMGKHTRIGVVIAALLLILGGQYVYVNENLVPAENRLHLPSQVISVVDTITNDAQDAPMIRAAMPSELVSFVRQYDSRIHMPYGREMLVETTGFTYENAIYDAMEEQPLIHVSKLVDATREGCCNYVVLNMSRELDHDPEEDGLILVSVVDGYYVYRDPEVTEVW